MPPASAFEQSAQSEGNDLSNPQSGRTMACKQGVMSSVASERWKRVVDERDRNLPERVLHHAEVETCAQPACTGPRQDDLVDAGERGHEAADEFLRIQ